MPRKAKPSTPPVPVTSPGQPYGVAGEQRAAMQAVPLPDVAASPPPAGGGASAPMASPPPPGPAGAPPPAVANDVPTAGGDPLGEAVMAALASPMPVQGGLTRPTERPDEDLLTPPPVMRPARVTPTARVLQMLAESNGNDPALQAIAADAAMKGY